MFFDGFSLQRVGGLRVRSGGDGPVVLLLHGHPRTHTTWWRVAPLLVDAGFTVVCADLPGYGESERTPGQTKREIAKPAEDWIVRDPLAWYRASPEALGPENYEDWRRAVTRPEVVRAMVHEYRAGFEVDRFDEAADRAAERFVHCPTLIVWSARDDLEELYGDPVAVWRSWTRGPLSGARIDSGHHMAEEAPEALAAALVAFL